MNLTVRVAGVDTLSLKVKYLIRGAQLGLKQSVPEAADLIVEEAKLLVPVDTGNLRDHIHQEMLVEEPEKQVAQVAPFAEADNKWGFDPAYARRIEYGFVGQDSLGRMYHQAAQPYMRPAFDAKSAEAAQVIKDGINGGIDNAASVVAMKRLGGDDVVTLEQIFQDNLVAFPAVSAIIGNRLYLVQLPQNPTWPSAVYQRISTVPLYTHNFGAAEPLNASVGRCRFQITSWHQGPSSGAESDAFARAIQSALLSFNAWQVPGSPATLFAAPNFILNRRMLIEPQTKPQLFKAQLDIMLWYQDQ